MREAVWLRRAMEGEANPFLMKYGHLPMGTTQFSNRSLDIVVPIKQGRSWALVWGSDS